MASPVATFYETDVGVEFDFEILKDGVPNTVAPTLVELVVHNRATFTATVVNAANAKYITLANDFPAGDYTAVLRVTFSASTVLHSDPFTLRSKALFT